MAINHTYLELAKSVVRGSQPLQHFFEVEIRNEAHGGVTPSDLCSALESLEQAPDDVVTEWFEGEPIKGLINMLTVAYLTHDWDVELRDLLP